MSERSAGYQPARQLRVEAFRRALPVTQSTPAPARRCSAHSATRTERHRLRQNQPSVHCFRDAWPSGASDEPGAGLSSCSLRRAASGCPDLQQRREKRLVDKPAPCESRCRRTSGQVSIAVVPWAKRRVSPAVADGNLPGIIPKLVTDIAPALGSAGLATSSASDSRHSPASGQRQHDHRLPDAPSSDSADGSASALSVSIIVPSRTGPAACEPAGGPA